MKERFFTVYFERDNKGKTVRFKQNNWSIENIERLMIGFKEMGYKAEVVGYGTF